MSTEKSYILKQNCNFQMQVYLSMCELHVDTMHYRVNNKGNRTLILINVKLTLIVNIWHIQYIRRVLYTVNPGHTHFKILAAIATIFLICV